MTSLLFNRCYFNLTFPLTGTEHQNKNTFDDRVYTRKIDTIMVFSFPSSWILDFGVSSRSQSHELQKLKMASLVKRPCFALNGQNNLWGCFTKRKRMFCSVKASGAQFQPTFCWFSSTNEHKNITDWWMLVLYPASEVVNSVISSSFISIFKEYTLVSPPWKFCG